MIKIKREKYLIEKNEWVIQTNEFTIPLYPIFISVLIMMFIFLSNSLNQLVAQNQVAIWQKFANNNPKCWLEADNLKVIVRCPEQQLPALQEPFNFTFNYSKNVSYINK